MGDVTIFLLGLYIRFVFRTLRWLCIESGIPGAEISTWYVAYKEGSKSLCEQMQCWRKIGHGLGNEVMVEESSKEVDQEPHLTMGWGGPEARKLKLGPAGYKQWRRWMEAGWSSTELSRSAYLWVNLLGQETGLSWTFLDIIIILTLVTKQFVMYLLCTEYKTILQMLFWRISDL